MAVKVRVNQKPSDAALAEARKRWGKDAHVRQYPKTRDEIPRDEARQIMLAARDRVKAIDAEIADRLKALDWYQALMAERVAKRKEADNAQAWALYFRCTVGTLSAFAFHVKGQGDTWDEAFAAADKFGR